MSKTINPMCEMKFDERVESRREDMLHILPGFMAEVTDGRHTAVVYSPAPGMKHVIGADKPKTEKTADKPKTKAKAKAKAKATK